MRSMSGDRLLVFVLLIAFYELVYYLIEFVVVWGKGAWSRDQLSVVFK